MRRVLRNGAALLLVTSMVLVPLWSGVDASIVRRFIYHPDPMPSVLEWGAVPAPEPITVRTDDGLDLAGFRWPATAPDHVTLVFFHGNAGNRYDAALMAAPLRRPDAEIVIASYRGYGGNPGKPSEAGLYRDGAAFLRYGQRSRPRRLYLFGFSLGGAVALHLATDPSVTGVVTLGAFSRLAAMAPRWTRALLPDRYDNREAARALRTPHLLLHGAADEVVPLAEATALKAANPHARLVVLKGADHYAELDRLAMGIWNQIGQMVSGPVPPSDRSEVDPD